MTIEALISQLSSSLGASAEVRAVPEARTILPSELAPEEILTNTLEIVDVLYPEMPEPEAKNALKQLVYLIRSNLGADILVSTPTGYSLGNVSSDAEDFLRSGEGTLWRGAYLKGLTEGWHGGVRDALTQALRERAEALLESEPAEAGRLGSILVEMEPFDGAALRLAVQGCEQSGNIRAARSAYRDGQSRHLEVGVMLPETIESFLHDQTST